MIKQFEKLSVLKIIFVSFFSVYSDPLSDPLLSLSPAINELVFNSNSVSSTVHNTLDITENYSNPTLTKSYYMFCSISQCKTFYWFMMQSMLFLWQKAIAISYLGFQDLHLFICIFWSLIKKVSTKRHNLWTVNPYSCSGPARPQRQQGAGKYIRFDDRAHVEYEHIKISYQKIHAWPNIKNVSPHITCTAIAMFHTLKWGIVTAFLCSQGAVG